MLATKMYIEDDLKTAKSDRDPIIFTLWPKSHRKVGLMKFEMDSFCGNKKNSDLPWYEAVLEVANEVNQRVKE